MLNKNLLRAAMAKVGVNQSKLSEKSGISKNTLSNKMNGKSCFDTDQIDRICEALGITDSAEKADIFLGLSSQKWEKETNANS